MNGTAMAVGRKSLMRPEDQVGAVCTGARPLPVIAPDERILVQGTMYLTHRAEPFARSLAEFDPICNLFNAQRDFFQRNSHGIFDFHHALVFLDPPVLIHQ